MAEHKRTRFLPQRCQHHPSPAHKHDQIAQAQSYNVNDVAITLSESITGPIQWTAPEKPLRDTIARILSKQGDETNPKFVSASTIFSLMKTIDDLCLLGLLFPTPHFNHASHPVLLEVGQARGRVGWTEALRAKPGPRTGPGLLIRLSTVRHPEGGKKKPKPLALREIVQVAVHEMVHAYLLLLSCRKGECGADFDLMHRDSDGGGHGLAFVALLKAILGQIQSWAPELGEFGLTDEAIHPYEEFSLKLWKRGEGISKRGKGQRVWWLAARPM